MRFTELTEEEYQTFLETCNYESSFFQMIENKYNREKTGQEVVLLALKNQEDEVVAASLFTKQPTLFGKYFYYSNRGPVMNFDDLTTVRAYFSGLTDYLKNNNASYVKIDPNWTYRKYDKDINVYEDYEPRDEVIQLLESMGYEHQGFSVGYTGTSQARWQAVLDLSSFKDDKELVKSFDNLRRRNIRKAERFGVKVRFLEVDEIEKFTDLYIETAERENFFIVESIYDYFENFKATYGDKVFVPLAYIEIDKFIASTKKEIKTLQKQLEQQRAKENQNQKTLNRIAEIERNLESQQEHLEKSEEFQEKYGNVLHLGGGLFFETPREMVYNAGASAKEFDMFVGPYMVHLEMMRYCLEHGIDRYNFYGQSGDFSEESEDYGVYRFKRGFGVEIEELVGDFVKVINPVIHTLHRVKAKANQLLKR